jgi:hypothetical protein
MKVLTGKYLVAFEQHEWLSFHKGTRLDKFNLWKNIINLL